MRSKLFCGIIATVILLSGCGSTGSSTSISTQSSAEVSSKSAAESSSSVISGEETSSENSAEEISDPEEINSKTEENNNGSASNTTPQDYSVEPVEKRSEIDAFDKQVSEKTLQYIRW